MDALLDTGVSVMAEGSVHTTRGAAEIAVLLPKADAVVIHCVAPATVTQERFRSRAGVSRRSHPAYADAENLRQMETNSARWAHFERPVTLNIPKLIMKTAVDYPPELDHILHFVHARGGVQ